MAAERTIASAAMPTVPVVVRFFDIQRLRDVIRRQFASQFSGVDPQRSGFLEIPSDWDGCGSSFR